jgi:hypothetical protein
VPAVEAVCDPPFRRRVHVLLPPSDFPAQTNAFEFWKKRFKGRAVVVHQLTQADFAKALLPQLVKGPGGVVECHPEWMYCGKYETR